MSQNQVITGPQAKADSTLLTARGGRTGESIVSELHGKYYETTSRKNVFIAHAIMTAPVIYTTAAGTGGPLLWNGSSTVYGNLLKVGFSTSVVTTASGGLGITGGTGQTAAPGTTTAIDGSGCTYLGGPAPQITPYRLGTVTNAGTWIAPFVEFHTGALTVQSTNAMTWVDLDGLFLFGPGSWMAIAGTATLTTLQVRVSLIWEEIPIAAVPS